MLYAITLAMRKIVHRIDAPLVASTMVMCMLDTVHQRIAQQQVGMRHVYFGAQRLLAILVFTCFHFLKQTQVFFYATVTIGAVLTGLYSAALHSSYFFCSAVIHISQSLLYQFYCKPV